VVKTLAELAQALSLSVQVVQTAVMEMVRHGLTTFTRKGGGQVSITSQGRRAMATV